MRKIERNRPKKFTHKMQVSLMLVFCAVILFFVGLVGRIYYINVKDQDRYKKNVLSQQSYVSNVIQYKRGEIQDRNATTLAISVQVFDLVIDPSTMLASKEGLEPTINAICDSFAITREEIQAILNEKPKSKYVVVQSGKGLASDVVELFNEKKNAKKSKITGVWFEEGYIRKYPLNTVGSDVLGFSSLDNIGSWGVEEYYNDTLNGSFGKEFGYFDSELKLQRTVKPAVNGNTLVMTIDANVQKIVEDLIAGFQTETGSKNMGVIIANPQNGEIYAMASNPTYDLNHPRDLAAFYSAEEIEGMSEEDKVKALSEIWRNFCISDAFEPGSTYKPFTVGAALDENVITDASTFVCDGKETVSGVTMKCVNRSGHGTLTLAETLMYSCNDSLIQIGLLLGRSTFNKYNITNGFGSKTGLDLPGEGTGIIHSEENLNPVELSTSSFGQTQTVTMVQLMAGFCSLINGGNYYTPHIVKRILNDKGATIQEMEHTLVKQTISSQTSDLLNKYLFQTVETGTAGGAKVPGYEIGGKTGTAQKRTGDDKDYLVSFIGFTPIEKPEVAIYVVIDEPNVEDQAHSTYATEFSAKVMQQVLPFLGTYPNAIATQ